VPWMSTVATTTARPGAASFLRARLGSVLAVLPLSVWTAVHLWNNLSAFQGGLAWQRDVTEYGHPLAFFAASLVALLPLAIHTVWGIGRLFTARPNNVRYKFFQNVKYTLQRLSAIGVLLFLGAHIWKAFLSPRIFFGRPETFAEISHEMHHHGPTLAVYVLGVLGVAYHLANGLHSFAMGWGVVESRRALRKLELVIVAVFLALLAMGWGSIYALWDAGR
jgi:succinate dehydrogenase / fumarate reductase, cytochrome b subunit